MTRINAGIPPEVLDDWRLIAEINEIPRVLELYQERVEKGINFSDIPKKFRLGDGHVKFFLNKLEYIDFRTFILIREYKKRNLTTKIEPLILIGSSFNQNHFNDYKPTEYDKQLVVTRIIETIKESDKLPYYYGKQESKESAINRLIQVAAPIEFKQLQTKLF